MIQYNSKYICIDQNIIFTRQKRSASLKSCLSCVNEICVYFHCLIFQQNFLTDFFKSCAYPRLKIYIIWNPMNLLIIYHTYRINWFFMYVLSSAPSVKCIPNFNMTWIKNSITVSLLIIYICFMYFNVNKNIRFVYYS